MTTELTNREQYEAITKEIDELDKTFKEFYQGSVLPHLPEFLVKFIDETTVQMKAQQEEALKKLDLDSPEALEGAKRALETMKAMQKIYNLQPQ